MFYRMLLIFNCFIVDLNATYSELKRSESSTAISLYTEQKDTDDQKKYTGDCYR